MPEKDAASDHLETEDMQAFSTGLAASAAGDGRRKLAANDTTTAQSKLKSPLPVPAKESLAPQRQSRKSYVVESNGKN
jgi:hypothetical protein